MTRILYINPQCSLVALLRLPDVIAIKAQGGNLESKTAAAGQGVLRPRLSSMKSEKANASGGGGGGAMTVSLVPSYHAATTVLLPLIASQSYRK